MPKKKETGQAVLDPEQMGRAGALALIKAFQDVEVNTQILMRVAEDETAGGCLAIIDVGFTRVGLTPKECRMVANAAEKGLRQFPGSPHTHNISNLIVALRGIADKAETS